MTCRRAPKAHVLSVVSLLITIFAVLTAPGPGGIKRWSSTVYEGHGCGHAAGCQCAAFPAGGDL